MRISDWSSDVCSSDLRGWNDYANVDVKGKTVVVLVNDPDWQQPLGQGDFEGRAMTYYGRWTYKFERSDEHPSELQSLMRISFAVFCLKKTSHINYQTHNPPLHDHEEHATQLKSATPNR